MHKEKQVMSMSQDNARLTVNGATIERPDCVMIVGNGRSGTNWLLELLDLSAYTFCRNEPDRSAGTPLDGLADDRTVCRTDQTELHQRWDEAVRWCATHRGRVDQRVVVRKDYVRPAARALGLWRAVQGPRIRRWLRKVAPSLRGEEWAPPALVCDQQRLERALPILKLVQTPGWATFALQHRPRTTVFHIVRHPGGFLNSWANRYLAKHENREVRDANRARLKAIAAEDPAWGKLFDDIDSMSTEESELWYWRYAVEKIHEAGQGNSRYHLINYESLARNPILVMRACYAACGLKWSDAIESGVSAKGTKSESIALSWRAALRAEQVALVEKMLAKSSMREWWNETEAATDSEK